MDKLKKKYKDLRNIFVILFFLSAFFCCCLYKIYVVFQDNSTLDFAIKILLFFVGFISFVFIPYCLFFYINYKNPFDFEFNSDIQRVKPITIINYTDYDNFDTFIKNRAKDLGYVYEKKLDFFEKASLQVFLKDQLKCSPKDDKIAIFKCKKLRYGRYAAKYKNIAYTPRSFSVPFRKMFFGHFDARGRIPNDLIKTIVFILVEEWSPFVDEIIYGIHEQDNIVVVKNKEKVGFIQITSDNRKEKGEDYFIKYDELMDLLQHHK